MRFSFAILTLVLVTGGPSFADNWAHWRGPTGNGAASADAKPPTEWSSTKNVKWKVKIPGRGSGSPIVWEDKVFVVTAIPKIGDDIPGGATPDRSNAAAAVRQPQQRQTQQRRRRRRRGGAIQPQDFVILCYNRDDGKLVWQQTATSTKPHQGTHSTNNFASASPCTDGKHVYAHFGSRGLYCYTMDGKLKWKRTDFEPMTTRNSFGEGSSPTIAGSKILVPWSHEGQSYLYALDKLTGETIWETKRDEPTEWSTPLVIDTKAGKQIVLNGQNCARGYDLESGKEIWRCSGQTDRPVASAVALGNLVIVTSGYRGSYMGAFKLNGRGDLKGTDSVAWSISRDTPDIASPVLSNGRVYFHKGKTGILTCVDAETGKIHYSASRIPNISSTYASPIAAGGYIFLTGRRGTTVVIKDSEQLEVVASNSVGEGVDATPAAVDNELFIRGEAHLFCIKN